MTANSLSHLFIVNPASGNRRGGGIDDTISVFCHSKDVGFEIRPTAAPGDAGIIAAQGVREGFSTIVSVGGDGTSSEIAAQVAGTHVKFAIIPRGSGNDFPSACSIPPSLSAALETAITGKCMNVDAGTLDGKMFINGLGIGMDGAIADCFPRYRFLGGFAGYLAAAVAQAFSFEGFPAMATASGRNVEGRCLFMGISNGASQGGFKISPSAKPDDGLLDFHFAFDMRAPVRIARLLSVAVGGGGGGWMERIQTERAEFETSRDLPAHMDGEPFVLKAGRHEVSVRKGALRVLSPEGFLS